MRQTNDIGDAEAVFALMLAAVVFFVALGVLVALCWWLARWSAARIQALLAAHRAGALGPRALPGAGPFPAVPQSIGGGPADVA